MTIQSKYRLTLRSFEEALGPEAPGFGQAAIVFVKRSTLACVMRQQALGPLSMRVFPERLN